MIRDCYQNDLCKSNCEMSQILTKKNFAWTSFAYSRNMTWIYTASVIFTNDYGNVKR